MGSFSSSKEREQWHKSFLPDITTASAGKPRLIYSYNNVFGGFAARLTNEELEDMKKKDGFIHAIPDELLQLETTHSPSFLGLQTSSPGFWESSKFGRGVIIGVLDTGVTPDHPSFRDEGMLSPPTKWKGVCQFSSSNTCNNKLIGARTFLRGMDVTQPTVGAQEPYDYEGHGTHTASTAAGMFVENANINGLANGTAAGMAPYAHLAIYKVCDTNGCTNSDVLAGFDSAVADGVDIISVSLGSKGSTPFKENILAIGSFGAMESGVFVSFSGGNEGPSHSTLSNEAPWAMTVGASTLDRDLRSSVKLGNGDVIKGQSAYQPANYKPTPLALVYPGSISSAASTCKNGSLDGIDVRGMVVLCDDGDVEWVDKGKIVKSAGGAAMIIANLISEGYTTIAVPHVLPVAHLSYADGETVKSYINSSATPTATIMFDGTLFGVSPSPAVACFSSRGPNIADPNILKPDIIAPGVNILAAWPFSPGPITPSIGPNFNTDSGTSMAAPHISGIAALLKSAHPDWSPAAIMSAMMTSANIIGNDGHPIADYTLESADYFAIGAGHVNPTKANVPGFIYDIDPASYIPYLCGLGYTDAQVAVVARHSIKCADVTPISGSELNYPSFMVFLKTSNSYSVTVNRTVTNVGDAKSTYTVKVVEPSGAAVTVTPETITFSGENEQTQFSVTFSNNAQGTRMATYSQGSLTWVSSDGKTTVRSPIIIAVV
ncbi:Peptidase S8 subtilisin-related protein [Dioscorea alata]|uniref:Peptidase S8 subtilisin-related protein n=1 Tax=Dioscorea alata TaxID=55571 RepID=A0ACB7WH54_DIOAL|nr:Peptidase S8 subtilisin-related protein [Dioscorea alata]